MPNYQIRKIILLIGCILNSLLLAIAQSPESDALFAQGVEKYQKGKYKDAEKLFRECWALDSIEMPENSFRREYSKEWLSSSLWHQGKQDEAKSLNPFGFDIEPTDRRLTTEIDRHLQEGEEAASPQMFEMKIKFAISEAEHTFGKEHPCIASLNCHLATFYLSWGDLRNAVKHIKIAEEAFDKGHSLTTFISAMSALIKGKAEFADGHIEKAAEYAESARNNFQGLATDCPFQYSKFIEFYTDVKFAQKSPAEALPMIDNAWHELIGKPESVRNKCFDLIYSIMNCQSAIDASDNMRMDAIFEEYYRIFEAFAPTLPNYPYEAKASMLERHAELLNARNDAEAAWDKICEAENTILQHTALTTSEIADLYLCKGQILLKLKRNEEALTSISLAAEGFKNRGKEWTKARILALQLMATAKSALGNDAEALPILASLPEMMNREGSFTNVDFARIYSDIAHIHARSGEMDKAMTFLLKAKEEYEKEENLFELPNYALIIRNLIAANCPEINEEAEFQKLTNLAQKADSLTATCVNATITNCKAILAKRNGDTEEAINLAQQAVDMFAGTPINVPLDFTDDLRALYESSGNLTQSLEAALNRIKAFEDSNAQNTMSYVGALMDASGMASGCLNFPLAADLLNKATDALHQGKDNFPVREYNWYLFSLADGVLNTGDIATAKSLMEESADYYNSKGVDKENLIWWLITKAKIAIAESNIPEALKIAAAIEKDIDLARKKENESLFLAGMGIMAKSYCHAGDLAKANDIYSAILPATPPEDFDNLPMHMYIVAQDYINVLNSLGETEKCTQWSLFCTKFVTAKSDSNQGINNVFSTLQTAYEIYESQGIEKAYEYVNDMTDAIVDNHGITSPAANAAKSFQTNFTLFTMKPQAAYELAHDYMQTMADAGKTPTADFIFAYVDAAKLTGNIAESKAALDLYVSVLKAPTRQQRLQILTRYAYLNAMAGDMDGAVKFYREAFDDGKQFVLDNFLTMSARERTNFWNNNVAFFRQEIPMAASLSQFNPQFSELAYDAAIFSSSLLLASDLTVEQAVKESSDRKVRQAYSQFLRSKAISQQTDASPYSSQDKINQARKEAEKDEKALLSLLADKTGNYNSSLKVDWKDVRNSLKENEAAVEFVLAKDDRGTDYYYALTLLPHDEWPVAIPLFYMHDSYSAWDSCYSDESLTQALWMPLASRLAGKTRVWFAPQGQLTVTAIESMPGLEKVTGRSDTEFCRLTSTRELALTSERGNLRGSAIIYGGINYSADSETLIKDASSYGSSATPGKQRDFDPSLLFADSDEEDRTIGHQRIPYLEGTLKEADFLEYFLKDKSLAISLKPRILRAEKGTESSFKALSGKSPALLHIGTHGFYIADPNSKVAEYFNRNINPDSSPEDQAMLRSGLLFAGAENTLYKNAALPDNVDDGVLSAKEIAALNLQGTDLTVLSACETALGNLSADGVFGLQRGFKKAGASALLMTLWKVNDEATTLLMKEFYTNWLKKGMNRYAALEAAKSTLRASDKWGEPKFWAPFILLDAH